MKSPIFLSLALMVGMCSSINIDPLLKMCTNPPAGQSKMSDKIALPDSYKISGSVTDWKLEKTTLLMESADKGFRVVEMKQDDVTQKWIQAGDKPYEFITSSGECDDKAAAPQILNAPSFASVIGNDTSSLSKIVVGIIDFVRNNAGFSVTGNVDVVGGVNAMRWVSCVNATNANKTNLLVEIRYGGDESIHQALKAFSNPILLSIRIAEMSDFNSTTVQNHYSIEFDRYELPTGNETWIDHGVLCEKRENSTLNLKHLDEFAATLNYFDHTTNLSEVVEVLSSEKDKMFIVSGVSFNNLLVNRGSYPKGIDYILHDYKFGYEFTMSQGTCGNFSALSDATSDAVIDNTDRINRMSIENLLVETSLPWARYQDYVDVNGNVYKTYRANSKLHQGKAVDEILELYLTEDMEVRSIVRFDKATRKPVQSLTVTRTPLASSKLNMSFVQIAGCYDSGNFTNNTWILPIKDKNIKNMHQVGLGRLNKAVAETISKNVYPVIPYRVVVFYLENRDGGLSMILRLAEKTDVKPANVGYNYTAELTTAELFSKINATLFSTQLPIEIEVDGKTEKWVGDAAAMKPYPADDNGFLGYTGGAMFVLAVFCLLIGVSIGAVGVFVVTRRQRISTLAYQVFE